MVDSLRSHQKPSANRPHTQARTSCPTAVPYGSTNSRLKMDRPSTNATETATTICTERRVDARWAITRCRMSTSSRADLARAPRTCRRPGPRSRALRISAATMMSADASLISSARCWRASGSGVRERRRSTSASRWGRRTGADARAEAGMACSRPTAPAMVSRSDSVHDARASTRRMADFSSAAPPKRRSQKKTRTPAAIPATAQRVSRSTTRPTIAASEPRCPANRISSFARSAAFCFSCSGLAGRPRTATRNRASPPPTATPEPIE